MLPWFQPMVREYRGGHWYLGEDFASCEQVRHAGFSVMAYTSIRLWHIGSYPYGWQDAGMATKRYASLEFQFDAAENHSD